jgi:hypothetical protein
MPVSRFLVSDGDRNKEIPLSTGFSTGFPAFCDRFERGLATLLKGCCGLFGGMCPRGVRVYPNWRRGMCGESDHDRILVGDPLQRLTDTLTKFLSCRERAGGVRCFSAIRVAGGCGFEACPDW